MKTHRQNRYCDRVVTYRVRKRHLRIGLERDIGVNYLPVRCYVARLGISP